MKELNEKQKQAIEMYQAGVKTREIQEKTGIERGKLASLVRDCGLPTRRAPYKKKSNLICPRCKHINPKGSRFCNMCGTDIRKKEDILIEGIGRIRSNLVYIQSSTEKVACDEITRDLIAYLTDRKK